MLDLASLWWADELASHTYHVMHRSAWQLLFWILRIILSIVVITDCSDIPSARSDSIASPVRRARGKRQRLPPSLLIENASD
jgi:hypothetical protein